MRTFTSLPTRRWPRAAVAALTCVTLAGGVGGLYVRSLDDPTPVAVSEVVDAYRRAQQATSTTVPAGTEAAAAEAPGSAAGRQTVSSGSAQPAAPVAGPQGSGSGTGGPGTSAQAAPAQPPPGVYVYDTAGWEQLDLLGGAHHDYPAQTTITLTREGCGSRSRWDVLDGRWDQWTTCLTDLGEEYRDITTVHQFFGSSDRREYRCDPGSVSRPAGDVPGSTGHLRCTGGGDTMTATLTVGGRETVSVGGVPVETVYLRMDATMEGTARGTNVFESWVRPSDGLLVQFTSKADTVGDMGAGSARYTEEYRATLASLDPRG